MRLMCCVASGCAQEFGDAEEYRRHCALHIEANIALHIEANIAAAAAAAREERQITLPAETWTGVLERCGHQELAERICFTGRLFHAIGRPMLDGPPGRILPELAFTTAKHGDHPPVLVKRIGNVGGEGHRLVELPLAETAPPQSVVGFSLIELKYFDAKMLSFLCMMHRRQLLNDICLTLYTYRGLWREVYQQRLYQWPSGTDVNNLAVLECLLRVFPRLERAITSLYIVYGTIGVDLLARLLTNSGNRVRRLRINSEPAVPEIFVLSNSYSSNCSPCIPVLVQWLHTPTEDGQQKMASLDLGGAENLAAFLTQAQQHFLSASVHSTPVPYFVGFYSTTFLNARHVELPFSTLHNEHTGEVLTLRYYNELFTYDNISHNAVLYRRRRPHCSDCTEESELAAMKETFSRALFSNESRNKLMLNVAQMNQIDESLFNLDSGDEPQDQQTADNTEL